MNVYHVAAGAISILMVLYALCDYLIAKSIEGYEDDNGFHRGKPK